jgi:hypothetical protein
VQTMKMNNDSLFSHVNKQNCFKKLNKLDSSSNLFVLQISTKFEPSLNPKNKKIKLSQERFATTYPSLFCIHKFKIFIQPGNLFAY